MPKNDSLTGERQGCELIEILKNDKAKPILVIIGQALLLVIKLKPNVIVDATIGLDTNITQNINSEQQHSKFGLANLGCTFNNAATFYQFAEIKD